MGEHMQIGEVAERTGLSLRTIRYYEEVGLVVPSARTQGGFRLYTERDVDRLFLAKRMKPLGFHLDEMRELLALLDEPRARRQGVGRLRELTEDAEQRCAELRAKLEAAEEFARTLRDHLTRRESELLARRR